MHRDCRGDYEDKHQWFHEHLSQTSATSISDTIDLPALLRFNDGTLFNVTIYDEKRELHIVDTHWGLTAMSSQLNESGL